jgi:hypothetical protein
MAETRPDNVIILTGGLSGSSALAGLLVAAGFWSGENTFRKRDYNTYENSELIRLNRQLMQRADVGEEYTMRFLPDAIDRIAALAGVEDPAQYRALLTACDAHSPWIWKEPRLWLTIRFWNGLLDWSRVRVLLLRRDHMQAWVSMTQRRQIQTYGYARRYSDLVESARKSENEKARGRTGLAEAVARNLFKLMAYKDEYEVARLYTDGNFRKQVETTFEPVGIGLSLSTRYV